MSDVWLMPETGLHSYISNYIRNSYIMGCPPVSGDIPRALASGLSYVQVGKHGLNYIYVDLAHHEIVCAKVGEGGINIHDVRW